jgi:hypothetical protein
VQRPLLVWRPGGGAAAEAAGEGGRLRDGEVGVESSEVEIIPEGEGVDIIRGSNTKGQGGSKPADGAVAEAAGEAGASVSRKRAWTARRSKIIPGGGGGGA